MSEAASPTEPVEYFVSVTANGDRLIESPVGSCFLGDHKTIALLSCGEPGKYGPMIVSAMNAIYGHRTEDGIVTPFGLFP